MRPTCPAQWYISPSLPASLSREVEIGYLVNSAPIPPLPSPTVTNKNRKAVARGQETRAVPLWCTTATSMISPPIRLSA